MSDKVEQQKGVKDLDDSGNFRLNNKRIMLTYKTHLDKEKYISFMQKLCDNKISFIRLAHETGHTDDDYDHTHALMEHEKTFETRNCRKFDFEGIHPHFRLYLTAPAWKNAKNYIAKEDPANADLKQEFIPNIVLGIMSCETNAEALVKYCNKPSDAPGILAIRNETTVSVRRRTKLVEPTYEWQKQLIEMTKVEPGEREIVWIYDKKGGAGKSCFTRYIKHTQGKLWYSCTEVHQCRDLAPIIMNALESGWEAWGWIFDLPREACDHKGFYSGIECLKNGEITGTKYRGKTVEFDIPHVIVFANFLPKTETMSMDRWRVFEIGKDMSMKRVDAYKIHRETKWESESESSSYFSDYAGRSTLGGVKDDIS